MCWNGEGDNGSPVNSLRIRWRSQKCPGSAQAVLCGGGSGEMTIGRPPGNDLDRADKLAALLLGTRKVWMMKW